MKTVSCVDSVYFAQKNKIQRLLYQFELFVRDLKSEDQRSSHKTK